MPVIPRDDEIRPGAIQGPEVGARANPGDFAQVGNALAQGGAQIENTFGQWSARYNEAKRLADVADLQAESFKKLGDAQFRWSKTPDNLAAQAGFDQEAGQIKADIAKRINDPQVGQMFDRHFTETAITKSLETRRAAFGLESSAFQGRLLTNLDSYAHAAAGAGNIERAQISDTAMSAIRAGEMGGWIQPDDAAKLRLGFKSQMAEVQVRRMMNDDAFTTAAALGDLRNFPDLNEKKRAELETMAVRKADMISRQAIAAQDKRERQGEKQLHIDQGLAEVGLFGRLGTDKPPTLEEVERMGQNREISPEGYLQARTAILKGELGHDDWNYVNDLRGRILGGDATLDEIRGAPLTSISGATKGRMMDLWASQQQRGPRSTDDYKDAVSSLKAAIVTTGPGSQFIHTDEQQKLAKANRELDAWIKTNKIGVDDTARIWEKIDEMLPRYQSQPPSIFGLPRPRLGEIKARPDIDRIAEETAQALLDGKIGESEAAVEGELLNHYRDIFDRQDKDAAARAAAKARRGVNSEGGKR